jgi:hypothetical protein
VQHREITDPDHGGSYTVKRYERVDDTRIRLAPEAFADGYAPIEVVAEDADAIRVIAELVEVLPSP